MTDTVAIRFTISIVLALAGAYMLTCGIRRKGILYSNTALHDSAKYETYVKTVRFFCFAVPAVFLINLVLAIISFSTQYSVEKAYAARDAVLYESLIPRARMAYNYATATLVASVAVVIIMIAVTSFMTARWSGDKSAGEKLSGDHPAFRKRQ